MYEELVKNLRNDSVYALQNCDFDFVHDWMLKAADAIEELQKALDMVNDAHNEGYDVGYWAGRRDYEPKWIPVTERLPSWGEDVLISISGFCNVGNLVQTNDEKQYNWYYSGWYHDPWEVTHWMPLPEPPKEET